MNLYHLMTKIPYIIMVLIALAIQLQIFYGGLVNIDVTTEDTQQDIYSRSIVLENLLSLDADYEETGYGECYRYGYEKRRSVMPFEFFTPNECDQETRGNDVVFVIDGSGSMDNAVPQPWGNAIDGADELSKDLPVVHHQGYVVFDDTASVRRGLAPGPIDNWGYLPMGGTRFEPALRRAQSVLDAGRPGAKDVIIFLSDGVPSDENQAEQYANEIKPETQVITIAYGAGAPTAVLRNIASGDDYYSAAPGSIQEVFQEIGSNLANQVNPSQPLNYSVSSEGHCYIERVPGLDGEDYGFYVEPMGPIADGTVNPRSLSVQCSEEKGKRSETVMAPSLLVREANNRNPNLPVRLYVYDIPE